GRVLALHRVGARLRDVRELVGEERGVRRRALLVLRRLPHEDHAGVADGEGFGAVRLGDLLGERAGVDADAAEVDAEALLEAAAVAGVEALAPARLRGLQELGQLAGIPLRRQHLLEALLGWETGIAVVLVSHWSSLYARRRANLPLKIY